MEALEPQSPFLVLPSNIEFIAHPAKLDPWATGISSTSSLADAPSEHGSHLCRAGASPLDAVQQRLPAGNAFCPARRTVYATAALALITTPQIFARTHRSFDVADKAPSGHGPEVDTHVPIRRFSRTVAAAFLKCFARILLTDWRILLRSKETDETVTASLGSADPPRPGWLRRSDQREGRHEPPGTWDGPKGPH